MAWRYAPLALVLLWIAATRWRVGLQRRRFGGRAVHFLGAGGAADRWRARAGSALFLVFAGTTVAAACGAVPLAASPWVRVAGLVTSLSGTGLMTVAQLQLGASWRIGIDPDARPGLVTHGFYARVRNPIFAAMFLSWLGAALLLAHPLSWGAAVGMALGVRLQVAREEAWLEEAYGDAWRAYAARVGRFTPWTGRLRGT